MPIKKKKISELPLASSLVGLYTIGVDAANKSVKVSLEWLKTAYDNVTDAIAQALSAASSANTAATNANTAKDAANSASTAANTAASSANTAKDAANQAAYSANNAASGATSAKDAANTAADSANNAASAANAAKDAANQAAESANTAASGADAAKDAANSAADRANAASADSEELNAHQPIIQNGTWWVWDLSEDEYTDTTLPARGPEGKGPIVLPNGNYGNWDETSQTYVDSGVPAAASVDLENIPVTFTQAETRDTINSGETVPTVFGKLKKWFADFGELAWKNLSDVGDMRKSVYDKDGDGVVDNASNSDKLEGKTVSQVLGTGLTITAAEERTNVASGDSTPTAFGKVMKWFSDLKALAFKDKVEYATDINGAPTSLPASDVYAWAKEATKPSYTASEVGAAPSDAGLTAEQKALLTFQLKANTVTTLANLPKDGQTIYANISANDNLSVIDPATPPLAGQPIHVFVKNTAATAWTIAIPTTGSYVCDIASTTLPANGRIEIDIVYDANESLYKIIVKEAA